MPAWRLDDEDRPVRQYDMGAIDNESTGFLTHAVLCLPENSVKLNRTGNEVETVHMGPPLGEKLQKIDVLGTAFPGNGEILQMKAFVDDRIEEQKADKARRAKNPQLPSQTPAYLIHPAYVEPDADMPKWRFSCSGFVLRAYLEAKIRLVDLEDLPYVSLETLKKAYPIFADLLDDQKFRNRYGIGASEPWPVVLVGYLANSMARSASEIRAAAYRPKPGNEIFPPQSGEQETAKKRKHMGVDY